jgi:hypothetical protein
MPRGSQATQEPSGTSSRTKSFQLRLARLPRPSGSKPSARRTWPLLTRSRISSWQDLSGQEGKGNYPLRCHGAALTSPPGGVLRLMPSTSPREACLTKSGLPWADSGRPDWILRHRRLCMVCLRLYSLLGIAGYAGLNEAMGRSRGGAARRNAILRSWPQTQPGMRAAGRGGSCPAQRDQATSTADLPGRGQ